MSHFLHSFVFLNEVIFTGFSATIVGDIRAYRCFSHPTFIESISFTFLNLLGWIRSNQTADILPVIDFISHVQRQHSQRV